MTISPAATPSRISTRSPARRPTRTRFSTTRPSATPSTLLTPAKVTTALDEQLFAGYIFYLNVTERELPQPVHERMLRARIPVLAMRTFGGRCATNFMNGDPDHPRRRALDAIYGRSGCRDRVEFCVRYPLSLVHVQTSVGSTGKLANLVPFLAAGRAPKPLPAPITAEIEALHRQWDAERTKGQS